jgi:glutamate-1-semialdehyde 2,1-aminomutase
MSEPDSKETVHLAESRRSRISGELFERAVGPLPGGNSRHTVYHPPHPIYAMSGSGYCVTDADGVRRVDFINNYASLIHGHCHPSIVEALHAQIDRLIAVGMPTLGEIELAEELVKRLPWVDQVRFTNSGTEAVMMAIKAARAYTGRHKIAKVEGAYHGSYDYAEVSQSAPPSLWGPRQRPNSCAMYAGTPPSVLEDVVVLPWNDSEAAAAIIDEVGHELAAIVIDPLPSRLAFSEASPAYLAAVSAASKRCGALFILDEIYCFRLGAHGAQGAFGVRPDLTCLGKIIGGGMPIGAAGGRADIMAVFDPRPGHPALPHGGTFNANPLAMTAGKAALTLLDQDAFHHLDGLGERLRDGMRRALTVAGVPGVVSGRGSFASLLITDAPADDYRGISSATRFQALQFNLHRDLLDRKVMTNRIGQFVISTPMTEAVIDESLDKIEASLKAIAA